ncbi:oligosaccharide flippase family protein [Clostridium sp. BJN0001]|uniref:oligosaccharide flippase family protein n=1 Tax=Clostridium sp. BJN0001 TaxID=2930219 RepID=UPI001FD1941D|nr:oligosaccharide flippase family protein [Clostridium sp. BJN0001]
MEKSITKNAAFKGILNLFNIILPIMVTPLVSRSIGKNLYGFIGYGDSLTQYFLIFASFGVYNYGLREISKVREDKNKLQRTFTSLFLFTTFTNIVTTLVYVLYTIFTMKNDPAFYTCLVMGLNIVFNLFYVEWVNEALENYDFIAVKTMVVRIVYSALILLFVRNTDDYLFYLYVLVIFNFINNIISFIYVKRTIKFVFKDLHFLKHIKPMFYAAILSSTALLYTQLDKIMLKPVGTTEVGFYYMAQRIVTIISTLMLTVIQVTMPRLSNYLGNDSKSEYLKLLKKVIKIYFLFLFPVSIGLCCLSKEAMVIFASSEFLPAVPVLAVFSIHMLCTGIESVIAQQIIYLHRREKKDTVLVLIGGVINLILNGALLYLGMLTTVSAIVTTLIANVIILILEYRMVLCDIKLDIKLFSFENMKYLIYSIPFIPITLAIKFLIKNMIISCFIQVISCVILYLLILIIRKDELFIELSGVIIRKIKSKIGK